MSSPSSKPTNPFDRFLDMALDTAADLMDGVSGTSTRPDPVSRLLTGIGLAFGFDLDGTDDETPAAKTGWGAVTDDPSAPHATTSPPIPRLADLENLRTFCAQSATMLSAGVDPVRAFGLIADDVAAGAPQLARALYLVRAEVRAGREIADSMAQHDAFPPMLVELVRAGEFFGHLPQTFDNAAAYFRDEIDHLNIHPQQPVATESTQ